MKWLEKLLEKTSYVKQLKRNLSYAEKEYENLHFMYNFLTKQILTNKTTARQIVRLSNSLLKKDELVSTKKQIQDLCHKIIKAK